MSRSADQLEICARQYAVANGLKNFKLATGEDAVRKSPGELIVCENGLEAIFVENAVSFADTEVEPVFWKAGKLLGKIQRGRICGAWWIEGDGRWLGALKCGLLVRARSCVGADQEVDGSGRD